MYICVCVCMYGMYVCMLYVCIYVCMYVCVYISDNAEATKILLDSGADINAPGPNGVTPLIVVCALDNVRTLEVLLSHPSVNINASVSCAGFVQQEARVQISQLRVLCNS